MISILNDYYLSEGGGRPYFGKPFFTMADVEKHRQYWARDPVTGRLVGKQVQNTSTNSNVQNNSQNQQVKQVSSADDNHNDESQNDNLFINS